MNKRQKQQILAIATIADHITKKSVLDKKEVQEIDKRLDNILSGLEERKCFFKRLA